MLWVLQKGDKGSAAVGIGPSLAPASAAGHSSDDSAEQADLD